MDSRGKRRPVSVFLSFRLPSRSLPALADMEDGVCFGLLAWRLFLPRGFTRLQWPLLRSLAQKKAQETIGSLESL